MPWALKSAVIAGADPALTAGATGGTTLTPVALASARIPTAGAARVVVHVDRQLETGGVRVATVRGGRSAAGRRAMVKEVAVIAVAARMTATAGRAARGLQRMGVAAGTVGARRVTGSNEVRVVASETGRGMVGAVRTVDMVRTIDAVPGAIAVQAHGPTAGAHPAMGGVTAAVPMTVAVTQALAVTGGAMSDSTHARARAVNGARVTATTAAVTMAAIVVGQPATAAGSP